MEIRRISALRLRQRGGEALGLGRARSAFWQAMCWDEILTEQAGKPERSWAATRVARRAIIRWLDCILNPCLFVSWIG